MKLNNKSIESKVNRMVKNYILDKIDVIDILEYYMKTDMKRLKTIIDRFNYDMLDEKVQFFENKNALTIEDIKDFKFYLHTIDGSVDEEMQKRSLWCQQRLLDIIAEEALASDLREILTDTEDKLSLESMLENNILFGAKYVESDIEYDSRFGNIHKPFYIKYTWEEYKEMYIGKDVDVESYKYKFLSWNDNAIYLGHSSEDANTTGILVSLAIATSIAILYERNDMEDEDVDMIDYMHACMNSPIITDVLNDMCITSSVNSILYTVIDTIDEIFTAIFVDNRSKEYILEYVEVYADGEIDMNKIKYFIDEVFKDYAKR